MLTAVRHQFPPGERSPTHTKPVKDALDDLSDIAKELRTLASKVTREVNDPLTGEKSYIPRKRTWFYLDKVKDEIGPLRKRLRYAQLYLGMTLNVAHR